MCSIVRVWPRCWQAVGLFFIPCPSRCLFSELGRIHLLWYIFLTLFTCVFYPPQGVSSLFPCVWQPRGNFLFIYVLVPLQILPFKVTKWLITFSTAMYVNNMNGMRILALLSTTRYQTMAVQKAFAKFKQEIFILSFIIFMDSGKESISPSVLLLKWQVYFHAHFIFHHGTMEVYANTGTVVHYNLPGRAKYSCTKNFAFK